MGLFDKLFKHMDNNLLTVAFPVSGRTADIAAVKDETFSRNMMGVGIAIYPTEGRIYSPVDGKLDLMFATSNAFSIVSNDGIEMFVHVGIDTYELKGEGFKNYKETDDTVKKGELILEFDRLLLQDRGYDETVMMVITNSDQFTSTRALTGRVVTTNDNAFEMRR